MRLTATGQLDIVSWDEQTYAQAEGGRRLSRVAVTQRLSGDLTGECTAQMLLCNAPDGIALVLGHMLVVGRIGGRSGSYVVQSNGVFDGYESKGTMTVVPGSGTGELSSLRGEGTTSAKEGMAALTLTYELD